MQCPHYSRRCSKLHVHLVIKSLKYLKSMQQPTPTQRGAFHSFSGRGPRSQIWRCWPSSQPLHIWLQTSPVLAEGHWRFCCHRTLILPSALIPKFFNIWVLYTSSCSLSLWSRKPLQCVTAVHWERCLRECANKKAKHCVYVRCYKKCPSADRLSVMMLGYTRRPASWKIKEEGRSLKRCWSLCEALLQDSSALS